VRSLRSRLLFVILIAVLFNTAVILAVVFWGSGQSRREWRSMVTKESVRRISAVVQTLWDDEEPLTDAECRAAFDHITHFVDEMAAFAVYDADKSPLYQWRNGAYDGVDSKHNLEPEFQVTLDGETIAWIAAVPSDFYFIEANKDLAARMVRILILGVALSIVAAVALSQRMSLVATKDAGVLASLLGRLSRGERGLPFPDQSIAEFQDISRASARLQDTLTKEERQRRQWTQDIAHDLKTPVTALQGQLEAVRDGVFNLTQERFESLEREFGQIDKLVRDLSLLSQVESPEMIPVIRKVDGSTFIKDICARFSPAAEASGHHLDCAAQDRVTFLADPDLLSRALNNLVQNAIQHVRTPGTITITLTAEGDEVAFAVENPGQIPKKDLPNLFERLYRGDSGRSSPGSGLGLTIVRAVADKLGGSVTARNTSRNTVRIRLLLPRRTS
jgi:two-component system sensor histidine kinase BaeS